MTTLSELLREASAALEGIDTATLDARLLVEHFTGTTRADAVSRPEQAVVPGAVAAVRAALARRAAGEPTHRIIGWREFYGLRLALSPDTLEPRPDTEALVDLVLPVLREVEGECRVLDLGTGTGAIALALLSQLPQAIALATDIASGAVEQARRNAETLGLSARFAALRSDWFSAVDGRFHGIVSNPPYISDKDFAALPREVRDFDPHRALKGGADGLDPYRILASGAASHLEPAGVVAVEIGYDQLADVAGIFRQSGFTLRNVGKDLGGHDRALMFGR
ncbi:MAG: peptide chain release factor N(5)-glutamine methyltransferase [Rhizobiaceae bacterium]